MLTARLHKRRDAEFGSGPPGAGDQLRGTDRALRLYLAARRRNGQETFPGAREHRNPRRDVGGHGTSTDVITEVAAEICARIADGTEVILPHAQRRRRYAALPEMNPGFIDTVNDGVNRRPGWDQRQSDVVTMSISLRLALFEVAVADDGSEMAKEPSE